MSFELAWFPVLTDGFVEQSTGLFGQQTRPFNEWATEIALPCFKVQKKTAKTQLSILKQKRQMRITNVPRHQLATGGVSGGVPLPLTFLSLGNFIFCCLVKSTQFGRALH